MPSSYKAETWGHTTREQDTRRQRSSAPVLRMMSCKRTVGSAILHLLCLWWDSDIGSDLLLLGYLYVNPGLRERTMKIHDCVNFSEFGHHIETSCIHVSKSLLYPETIVVSIFK